MIVVNCDIGERGAEHPVDRELMSYIGMANIACGGHAGDAESVKAFSELADKNNVKIAAHLSYPDRDNFGRTSMNISFDKLSESLDSQFALIKGSADVKSVKFHGALYNDANVNDELAKNLAGWLKENGLEEIVTPFDSALAEECKKMGLSVFPEAFAERNYAYDQVSGRLLLVSRAKDYASIHDCDLAVAHAEHIIKDCKVNAFVEKDGVTERQELSIEAETICIHSDSPIALELAKRLAAL